MKKKSAPKTEALAREESDGLSRLLLDSLVSAIVDSNMPRKYAATSRGVSPKTFELWIAMGASGTGNALHTELARRVYEAEGSKVGRQMGNLEQMGTEDPSAAVAYLKFFKPGDFGGVKPEADEFDTPQRNADRQDLLLDHPPPRMLAKFRDHGWWKFDKDLEEEDRLVLLSIQDKYRRALPLAPPASGAGA